MKISSKLGQSSAASSKFEEPPKTLAIYKNYLALWLHTVLEVIEYQCSIYLSTSIWHSNQELKHTLIKSRCGLDLCSHHARFFSGTPKKLSTVSPNLSVISIASFIPMCCLQFAQVVEITTHRLVKYPVIFKFSVLKH